MADCNFLQKAIQIVTQATEEDKNKNYEEAFRLYSLSFEYFMATLKWEKNEKCKTTIKQKMCEYLMRAEKLKEYLDKQKTKTAVATGGQPSNHYKKGKDNGDKGEKGDEEGVDVDPEKARLRGALETQILREKPNVKWDDVAGLHAAKDALKEAVIFPIRFPHLFTGGRRPWKGILLYGPPGTGKSYLAKAVATEANSTFFSISSSDLVSKWLGESERLVRNLFELARENRPAIIFIDEIDSLCSTRSDSESESARRIKTEFLIQMDGIGKDAEGILVLAATNIPWTLDAAIRRRCEKRIYIPLPDAGARYKMFKMHLAKISHSLNDHELKRLADRTDGYSGSDIAIVVRDAMMQPIRIIQDATHFKPILAPPRDNPHGPPQQFLTPCSPGEADRGVTGVVEEAWTEIEPDRLYEPKVAYRDIIGALTRNRASVNRDDLERYEKFTHDFGQEG